MCVARGFDRGGKRVILAHISRMSARRSACLAYLFRCRIQFFLRAPDQNQLRAVLGEPPGDRQVDSAAAARDQRRFPASSFDANTSAINPKECPVRCEPQTYPWCENAESGMCETPFDRRRQNAIIAGSFCRLRADGGM
jgi:hypothetical protein